MITIDDFKKLEIKICTVVSAEKIENADKLLKLEFDVGTEEPIQIMSGIAEYYPNPEDLIGRQMPVLLNLEPRELRGYKSNGMLLAASDGEKPILLSPDTKVPNGTIVS